MRTWDGLGAYKDALLEGPFISECARRTGLDPDVLRTTMEVYVNEIDVGLALLESEDLAGKRVLEVGAGMGFLAVFLAKCGVDVEAIEPDGPGFESQFAVMQAVNQRFLSGRLRVHRMRAEELNPQSVGQFDVVYSVNVLEHVDDFAGAVQAIASVLHDGGKSINLCPNYVVPFEPHYGIPLLPGAPAATPWASRLKAEPLWRSLNFVTYGEVRSACRRAGLSLSFKQGLLAQSFERILVDPVFAARHGSALAGMAQLLKWTGVLNLVRLIPARFASPMIWNAVRPYRPAA